MKLKHTIVALGCASLAPLALAQLAHAQEVAPEAVPFTISLKSEVAPLEAPALHYPIYAGSRGLSGECEVAFAISTEGVADAVRVLACSSDAFRWHAKTTVEAMTFPAREAARDNVRMTISWDIEADRASVQTASLD